MKLEALVAGAAIAGFLLTSVPAWTGSRALAGPGLMGLAGLWLAGRISIFFANAVSFSRSSRSKPWKVSPTSTRSSRYRGSA